MRQLDNFIAYDVGFQPESVTSKFFRPQLYDSIRCWEYLPSIVRAAQDSWSQEVLWTRCARMVAPFKLAVMLPNWRRCGYWHRN